MPRPLRLEFENAWYHVMNRGAGKQAIFNNDTHRKKFLDIISQAVTLFGIEIHAYCLMDNHYHLLIKTPRANLSRTMRHINGVYTQYYNLDQHTDGSLFRGRYKSIIVDGDDYLLQVNRYIHLNALESKLVRQAHQYRWSSYPDYLQPSKKPFWLEVNLIKSMVSQKNHVGAYQNFIEEGLDAETKDFYGRINRPIIFGALEKKEKILKKISLNKINSSLSDYKRTKKLPSLEKISNFCAKYFNIKQTELYQAMRGKKNEPRMIAIYGSRVWASERLSVIADLYQCGNHSSISNTVRKIADRIKSDKKLEKRIAAIMESVTR